MVEAAQVKLLVIISMVCLFSSSQTATLLNFLDIFLWIKGLKLLFLRLFKMFELLLVEVLVPVKFQISDFLYVLLRRKHLCCPK